ncbi:hypothetical protein [Salsipaludibacter albus]|uniref:hypothetical protein n=1 Tax=Salsipaludibacter albus TaxID=2849650 RepID=UPI001EE3CDD1|nr:hypothetical protein [Salsipaludibacter albus]MBY5162805.1 hypothetical protein [Salsipaludibacter albus]
MRPPPDLAARVVRLPDQKTFQQTWQSMAWGQRREVLRSVNRGQAMRRRKDARLAVMVARQQQRYWRWAWLFAPVVALILLPNWVAVAVNAVLLGLVMGGFAWFRHRRAVESERANLERLQ